MVTVMAYQSIAQTATKSLSQTTSPFCLLPGMRCARNALWYTMHSDPDGRQRMFLINSIIIYRWQVLTAAGVAVQTN